MPYVEQNKRKKLDLLVREIQNYGVKADGDLNYILFAFCKRYIKPGYNNYKNYCGELRQCVTEIERRMLSPYEDKKIQDNGDVE